MWQVKSSGLRNVTSTATKLNDAVLVEGDISLEIHERFKKIECEWRHEDVNEDESVSFAFSTFIKSVFQPLDHFGIKVFHWNLKIWHRQRHDLAPGWCCLWHLIVSLSRDRTINVRVKIQHLEKEHNNGSSRHKSPE